MSCNNNLPTNNSQYYDSITITKYIAQGDAVYRQKNNYDAFSKSIEYYDTAHQIASRSGNKYLIAQTTFALGRAYDALNEDPQKTIDYYTEASSLYAQISNNQNKALYIKHLVAHSYDKIQDSLRCIKILNELYKVIYLKPDSIKKQLPFIVEMALISSVIKNYSFANTILQNLTKRSWIKNDSTEYDYLNHFYLVKAQIDINNYHNPKSVYLDSLIAVFNQCSNLSDSLFYSQQIADLYQVLNNKSKTKQYLDLNTNIFHKFNSAESVRDLKLKLSKMENNAITLEKMAIAEKNSIQNRNLCIVLLLLLAISLLSLFLYKRNNQLKRKKNEVVFINKRLEQKNLQNEWLNKEIHHRVKNNLQMILSLVYMQENNSNAQNVKENMQNIRLRIESIAQLHKQLAEQTDEVDLRSYIQFLVSNSTNLILETTKIITHLNIDTIKVSQNISFPLGLIINEWITNSIKYVLPHNNILEIYVSVTNSNNFIILHYKDNGTPQTKRPEKKSIGLEIVHILLQQLEAKVEENKSNIYDYKITIPIE
jgi:two-component sensor histidine kinase